MPLDPTVRLGPEIRLFLSSAGDPANPHALLSIDTKGIATELGTVAQMGWQELGFVRYPVTFATPQDVIDIRKRFDIDHVKRGPEQRLTGSFQAAYQNSGQMVRRFFKKYTHIKIEWHVEDIGAVDEYEYFQGARFTTISREAPEREVLERAEFTFAEWGHRDGP